MTLDLPDGTHIHILVAPGPIAPAWAAARSPEISAVGLPPAESPATQPRRRLLKGTAVLVLIVGAYLVGEHAHPVQALTAAQAQYRAEAAAPSPSPSPSRDMQALRQQLQAPPIVTPAPGAPAPASHPGADGFGMEN